MAQRWIAATLMVVTVAAGCSPGGSGAVLGVIIPSSADHATYAKEVEQGARLAVEELARRGGRAFTLQVRKVSSPADAISAARDLARRHDPVAIIGVPEVTPFLDPNNPVSREEVPILSIGSASDDLSRNPHLFRLTPSAAAQASVLAHWTVATRGMGRIALIASDDSFGSAGLESARLAIAASAGEVVEEQRVAVSSTDLAPQAQAIRSKSPEAVIMWLGPQQAARYALAADQVGLEAQLIGPDRLMRGEFRALAGQASENVVISFPELSPSTWFDERMRDWFLDLHRRFTIVTIPDQRTLVADLPFDSAAAYDAVMMIASVFEERDRSAALRRTVHHGVLFSYRFDEAGESFTADDLSVGRFYNLTYLNDVTEDADLEEQIAFYKVQASAYFVPDAYLDTPTGRELADRVLEQVLEDPEGVEFFRPYTPPKPPPGPV